MTNYTDIDLATALNLLAEKDTSIARYKEMSGAYEDSIERLTTERQRDLERVQDYIRRLDIANARIKNVTEFIQASIDREEWTEDELNEIFWEELAEMLNLDLKQTEEIEVRFLVTYEASLTVPKGTDIDDLELTDLAGYPDVYLNGTNVGEARLEDTEVNAL